MPKGAVIYSKPVLQSARTWDEWVRLSIAAIHALKTPRQNYGEKHKVWFHLNHPIRFVCVTGPIIAFGDLYSKYTFFRIDDGSGQTIEVKLCRLDPEDVTPQAPSNTKLPNMNIVSSIGSSNIYLDDHLIDIGSVLKLKCAIDEFRGSKQLILLRAERLKSTADEIHEWKQLATWAEELSKPLIVSVTRVQRIERRVEAEFLLEKQKKEQRLKAKELRRQALQVKEARQEQKRLRLEAEVNASALI